MNLSEIIPYFIGLGLLLLCSSFFSGSETALTALTITQIQRMRGDKKKSSHAILRFLDDPRRLFITVLFGNTLVNMSFVSITGMLIYNSLFRGRNPALAYVVAILFQTLLLLVCGEITPKTYALNHSERIARVIARPLWFFSQIIYPFRKALRYLTDLLLPLFGVKSMHEAIPLTSDEIRAILKSTEESGALHGQEGEIIHNIFELNDISAKEVMVPRTEMVCVDVTKTIREAFALTKDVGYSRLPVYRENIDNICGIFYIKDFPLWKGLKLESLGGKYVEDLTIEEFLSKSDILNKLNPGNENTLIRPPLFTIKSKKIGPLMLEMTRDRQQMGILLDEFGGVVGLITVEDIVEEVVGEIFDEYDKVSALTIKKDPKDPYSLLIPGFVSLRSLNRRLNINLNLSMVDTLGGYVVRLFGSIPKEGDSITDPSSNIQFQIIRMEGARVDLVKARFKEKKKPRIKNKFFELCLLFFICVPLMGATGAHVVQGSNRFTIVAFSFLLILSLSLRAFYAGSETAVVSVSEAKINVLSDQENANALIIKKLRQAPDKMLGIILIGTNLMSTASGVAGLQLVSYIFPGREGLQQFYNTIIMTFLILVFCEILPKTIFRAKADSLALSSAPGLEISGFILQPFVTIVTKITRYIIRITEQEEYDEKLNFMREELKLVTQMGERDGLIKKEQLQMIYSVLDLENMTIDKIMTPLIEVIALPAQTSIDKFYTTVSETGYSRIPIYEERVDNIIGIVNVLDVLYAETPSPTIAPYINKELYHEPESKRVHSLLRELRHSAHGMVFVVDEYGGIIGLITIEDIIEEILGDIWDEKDRQEDETIRRISDNVIECDGKTEIHMINHTCDMSIPLGDYKTIAGYVTSLMEKIPKRGEFVETESLKIVVLNADPRSVRKVRIIRK
ncbi:MAG: hemolysin family protein [bacterium]